MNDEFDELDRALFALPLATPPPDMRAAILRATVGAHAVRRARAAHPSPFSPWEILALGTGFAITVWLVLLLIYNHAAAATANGAVVAFGRAFADPALLFWLLAGGAVAAWVSLVHAAPLARSRS